MTAPRGERCTAFSFLDRLPFHRATGHCLDSDLVFALGSESKGSEADPCAASRFGRPGLGSLLMVAILM